MSNSEPLSSRTLFELFEEAYAQAGKDNVDATADYFIEHAKNAYEDESYVLTKNNAELCELVAKLDEIQPSSQELKAELNKFFALLEDCVVCNSLFDVDLDASA